jgi:gamma-glutamyltranspeptidase/glutathione hydrolase
MENGFPDATIGELQARGHDVVVGQGVFGSANILIATEDGSAIDVGAESRTADASGTVIPGSP